MMVHPVPGVFREHRANRFGPDPARADQRALPEPGGYLGQGSPVQSLDSPDERLTSE